MLALAALTWMDTPESVSPALALRLKLNNPVWALLADKVIGELTKEIGWAVTLTAACAPGMKPANMSAVIARLAAKV